MHNPLHMHEEYEMRVYIAATLPGLARAVDEGGFGPAPLPAHAVTPALREWYATGDSEELEYAATEAAARDAIAELADRPDVRPRRVVVVADLPDGSVLPEPATDSARSAVIVQMWVPMDRVASVHIDDAEAEPVVRAAASAYPAAVAGDEDAAFTVDEAFGHELLWYARQEIPDLTELG